MPRFPVILEHSMSVGLLNDEPVGVSVLDATAPTMFRYGANEILIPAPTDEVAAQAKAGIELLPPGRRKQVRLVDEDDRVGYRVRSFMRPIWDALDAPEGASSISKWRGETMPDEAALALMAENFLYHISLASKYRAGVAYNSVSRLRELIGGTDPHAFTGEAAFRLKEISSLASLYHPHHYNGGDIRLEIADSGVSERVWDVMETTEFLQIVQEAGMLGYAMHPITGLKTMSRTFARIVRMTKYKLFGRLLGTTVEAAGAGLPPGVLEQFADSYEKDRETGRVFSPVLYDTDEMQVAAAAYSLKRRLPTARPAAGYAGAVRFSRASMVTLAIVHPTVRRTSEDSKVCPCCGKQNERW